MAQKNNSKKKNPNSISKKETDKTIKKAMKGKGAAASFVTYAIPIILIMGFLVGSFFLFMYVNDLKYEYDDQYKYNEKLVNDKALIGLTFEECQDLIHGVGYEHSNGYWVYVGGRKFNPDDISDGFGYEVRVYHKDGLATRAVMRIAGS